MKKAIIGVLGLFCALGLIYFGMYQYRVSGNTENDTIATDTCLIIPDSLDVDSIIFQEDSLCNE